MAKPKPLRIPSDDFELEIGGRTYHTHEGEWVELYPSRTVADQKIARQITIIQAEMSASAGDEDEQLKRATGLEQMNDAICRKISETLVAWTWTDDRGQPLPQPTDNPKDLYETVISLRQEEVMYLYLLAIGASVVETERKNGSRPLQTSGAATGRRPARR